MQREVADWAYACQRAIWQEHTKEGWPCHAEIWSNVICFVYAQIQCCTPVKASTIRLQLLATREHGLTIEQCKVATSTIRSPSFQVYLLVSIVIALPSILPSSSCS